MRKPFSLRLERLQRAYREATNRWGSIAWPQSAFLSHVGDETPSFPVDLYLGGAAGECIGEAWTVIESEIAPTVIRMLARCGDGTFDADDAWSQARLKLYEPDHGLVAPSESRRCRIIRFRGRSSLSTFLVTVSRRVWLNEKRKRSECTGVDSAAAVTTDADDLAGRELAQKTGSIMVEWSASLPERDKFILHEVLISRVSQKKIAARLGMSEPTVSRLIRRNLDALGLRLRKSETSLPESLGQTEAVAGAFKDAIQATHP